MKVYFYTDHIDSIRKYGYLSVRAQYNTFGKIPIIKYKGQYSVAKEKYTDVANFTGTLTEKILQYLDWRDECFNQGSYAIYFLYYPIPNLPDIKDFIKTYRYDFLNGKTLLEYDLKDRYCSIIADRAHKNKDYWIKKWRSQPREKDLWFVGIPHGYFIPKNGKISFSKLKIVDQKLV